jgi:hypothetical protein
MNLTNVTTLRDRLRDLVNNHRENRWDMSLWIAQGSHSYQIVDPTEVKSRFELAPNPTFHADPSRCGTAACLGGWACLIANEQKPNRYPGELAEQEGGDWLDLDEKERCHWFMGYWHYRYVVGDVDLGSITLNQAITFLNKVIANNDPKACLTKDELSYNTR